MRLPGLISHRRPQHCTSIKQTPIPVVHMQRLRFHGIACWLRHAQVIMLGQARSGSCSLGCAGTMATGSYSH